jgi:hypothetical protein
MLCVIKLSVVAPSTPDTDSSSASNLKNVFQSLIVPVRVSVIMPSVVAPSATDTDSSLASNL